ncbi:MAG: DUF1939 domain-containing protein, partial [Rickettsia endosymbiont of Ixodes persulcatus]|nr:DUF1939 domain-containing protein [Rickettsia endosymbiont of Ixodes persulcatus]
MNLLFESSHIVGWTRENGLAAVISNAGGGTIKMFLSTSFAGKTFIDITGNVSSKVIINEDGTGNFSAQANS